jgi:hypothetical protein
VVVAAGCTVIAPEVAPLRASVLTPATSAVSLIVTELVCSSLPETQSNRATALSDALEGPTTSPEPPPPATAAQLSPPLPLFFR